MIYYVGARLSQGSCYELSLCYGKHYEQCHVTLMYSRVWFPYKPTDIFPLAIEPPFSLETFGQTTVLRFNNIRLSKRHTELRNAGGTWDYETFKAHISLGNIAPMVHVPAKSLTLSHEYYMTWKD